jgi:SAM-dependent methyltransferase
MNKIYNKLPVSINDVFQKEKTVLDVCCGPKGMWFDKQDERALFLDRRFETHIDTYLCGTKTNIIAPDIIGDFTDIKQPDNSFWHVVFDPPHIERPETNNGQLGKKYGLLNGDWREMLRKGFSECFRVLKPNGTLIFKWNETEFSVNEILKLTDKKPLYGHKSGKKMQTHWICFIK